jgi:hypothetical protein
MTPLIRVYDEAGKVIETHEHARDCKEWVTLSVHLVREWPLTSDRDYRNP